MLRRTTPAVSFTASHRALMLRSNKPLLGHEMNSTERYKAAWDEIPLHTINWSRAEVFQWYWRCTYDLGLRDPAKFTKIRAMQTYGFGVFFILASIELMYPNFYYMPMYQTMPDYIKREGSEARGKAWGVDVIAPDGKFIKPYFHISPPMFTMKLEDL